MKTTKVALINPTVEQMDYQHPLLLPLSLAYLAAVLKREGHEVKLIDCPASHLSYEELKKELSTFDPELIGITSTTPNIFSAMKSASAAKEACPNAQVIMGGPHVTFRDAETLQENPNIDIIVRGEGELTMLELAALKEITPAALKDVKGITFRNNGEAARTGPREFIQDLDALPRPAYECFPLEKYRIYGKMFMPMLSSRGCPFQCAFCVTTQLFGPRYRSRSTVSVLDELEWLKNEYHADGISFYDDTVTLDRKRLFALCDGMIERKLGLPWGCQTRVDVTKEELAKMRQANCNNVAFGVESGCQKTLDKIHKRTSIEQNINAVRMAKKENFFVAVSALIAYPGETLDDVKQTVELLRRMEPDDAYLCIATPYPGTELRTLVENLGWKISNNWSLYNTMNPVIDNPLVPAEEIAKLRTKFYNSLYTPRYVIRQAIKGNVRGNFYSKLMTRMALNHLIWRARSIL